MEDKAFHGKYPIRASEPDLNSSLTHQWIDLLGLKSETEGFIIAAQNQSVPTRNFQANMLENGADPNCRICDKHTETIDHFVSGCPLVAFTEYLNQHDRLGQDIHWCLCKSIFCHMKAIGKNINHQRSLKTKTLPFYWISTSILTGQSRQIDQAL